MSRLVLRIASLTLAGGGAIAAASVTGLFWWAQDAAPPSSGRAEVAELRAPVEISRDPFGVPHIRADALADAFVGLGFAQAQDRLWQMDLLRRYARGTLSEVFGKATLPEDRLARTLGLGRAAEAELETLSAAERELLQAYARGVNAWIVEVRRGRAPWPFELRWLGHDLPDWSVADSLAVLRFRSWSMSGTLSASLLLDQLKREIGSAYNHFYPDAPVQVTPELVGALEGVQRLAARFASGAGLYGPVGSLALVIGPGRSSRGLPLLANDMHLEFRLPSLLYFAHIKSAELELAGPTWPGIPVFFSGTNRTLAWGQVALHASTSEIYDETLHPEQSALYDRNGRWLETVQHAETIHVRYGADRELEVRITRHGPLLATAFPADSTAGSLALQWAGDTPRSGIRALLALQRAQSWEEFREALRHYPAPAATFVYADVSGNIGSQVAGRLPIRTVLMDGLLPVPGRTRMYDWRGIISFEELPSSYNGRADVLVVTPHAARDRFPHGVSWLWRDAGAGERAREVLKGKHALELSDLLALQRELRSARAEEAIRRLVAPAAGRTPQGARVRDMLLAWDGSTATDSVGAAVYHSFRQRLIELLLHSHLDGQAELAPQLAAVEPAPGMLLGRFLERARDPSSAQIVERALEDTWSWLRARVSSNPQKWAWGEVHRLRLSHPFEQLGSVWLRPVGARLGRGPYPAPGDAHSVWAMHHSSLPSDSGVGPVMRYAVDLADPGHARMGLAGGQSGHPGSALYDDALADWLAGKPRPLWMHPADVAYQSSGRWELHPGAPPPYP